MQITGQCHCGAITFKATVDPKKVLAIRAMADQHLLGVHGGLERDGAAVALTGDLHERY